MIDPIAMLKRDHREVEEMLTKLQSSKPGPRRRSTVEQVTESLQLHMEIEEKLLYPLVSRVLGAEKAEEAEIEHRLAREGVAHLNEMVDAPGFGAVVDMLKAGIKHHVREEEREIFPKLKQKLDRTQLAEIGEQALALMPPNKRTKVLNASKRTSGRRTTRTTKKRATKKRAAKRTSGRRTTRARAQS
ncbi:MAG TPA: hemerythrin domain-containing protein [Acidimicrobiia bacterium]|jgi:hemerythrin-like domain-containing protein|nr:hemerythrin domain-containing protein [Acidimicrobiia bacterium]